jgi:hypothetical protein
VNLFPAILVGLLVWLIITQLLYAFWPYRRRDLLTVLVSAGAGVLLGQVWELVGLPGLRLGQVDVVPAAVFAAALQPLAERLRGA